MEYKDIRKSAQLDSRNINTVHARTSHSLVILTPLYVLQDQLAKLHTNNMWYQF